MKRNRDTPSSNYGRLTAFENPLTFTAMEHHYLCPYCWQENDIFLYSDDGDRQQTVIDCRVCCQPATIDAVWDPITQSFELSVDREAGE